MLSADEPQTFYLDVAYTGGGGVDAHHQATFDARAGRWLGNPELEVTVTDESTGDEVAFGSDRQPFTVAWAARCDVAADCTRTYRIDLALAAGREAEIDWFADLLYYTIPPDHDDTDAEPLSATLEISD